MEALTMMRTLLMTALFALSMSTTACAVDPGADDPDFAERDGADDIECHGCDLVDLEGETAIDADAVAETFRGREHDR